MNISYEYIVIIMILFIDLLLLFKFFLYTVEVKTSELRQTKWPNLR